MAIGKQEGEAVGGSNVGEQGVVAKFLAEGLPVSEDSSAATTGFPSPGLLGD